MIWHRVPPVVSFSLLSIQAYAVLTSTVNLGRLEPCVLVDVCAVRQACGVLGPTALPLQEGFPTLSAQFSRSLCWVHVSLSMSVMVLSRGPPHSFSG